MVDDTEEEGWNAEEYKHHEETLSLEVCIKSFTFDAKGDGGHQDGGQDQRNP